MTRNNRKHFVGMGVACAVTGIMLFAAAQGGANAETAAAKAAPAAKSTKTSSSAPSSTAEKSDKTTYSGPPVLEPGQFFGEAAMGYASAKAAPEVMSKLFCYCGCDSTDNHSRLIDCFTGLHGTDCHICQEEAVMALRMYRQGSSIPDIQKRIDQEYAHYYPFQEDTANYKKYKATRLWKFGDAATATDDATKSNTTTSATPKVKPGFKVGDCCKADHNK